MVELSKKRIEEILNEETAKTEELPTILRGVYTRYMCLFEKYFADIDALNDEKVAEFRKHHEETKSLIKYYYMDIPLDICAGLEAFEKEYCDNLLGTKWHDYLYSHYEDFRKDSNDEKKGSKEEFSKQTLSNFYDVMDYIFRDGFGTESKSSEEIKSGILGLLFGEGE